LEILGHIDHEGLPLMGRNPTCPQRKLDVLANAQVRIKGVALKDHGHVAVLGIHIVHYLPANADGSFGWFLQSGDETEHRRLPTTRWAKENQELTGLDLQGKVINGHNGAKAFGDMLQRDASSLVVSEQALPRG
jgi:hypothetical protein